MTRVHLVAQRRRSISSHQHSEHTEHHADRQSNVETHILILMNGGGPQRLRPRRFCDTYGTTEVVPFPRTCYQKIQLRSSSAVSTTTARTAGFWYHARPTSFGRSVSAYTNPLSSPSGRGLVSRETRIVTVKHEIGRAH